MSIRIMIMALACIGLSSEALGQKALKREQATIDNRTADTFVPSDRHSVLPAEAFLQAVKDDSTAILLDVRTPEEYQAGHLDGAQLLNWKRPHAFRRGVLRLNASHTLYIYCQGGVRSNAAAGYLSKKGFRVVELKGGYKSVL